MNSTKARSGDPAVEMLVIFAANKAGKYIGIYGQGPSDHPDLAEC